jgi:hypothetical protein
LGKTHFSISRRENCAKIEIDYPQVFSFNESQYKMASSKSFHRMPALEWCFRFFDQAAA